MLGVHRLARLARRWGRRFKPAAVGHLQRAREDLAEATDDEETKAEELKALFEDAWRLVRPVFWPILSVAVREALMKARPGHCRLRAGRRGY